MRGKVEISNYQRDLMRHTISNPGRNWFGTSLGCKDSDEFEELVTAGYATKEPAAEWMGDDVIYRLTVQGKKELTSPSPLSL